MLHRDTGSMWNESQVFKQSSSRKKITLSLNKSPHNFGMESRIEKIKRSLESALEWLSNDVIISEIIKFT